MEMLNNKPHAVKIVGWGSIVLGLLVGLSGVGNVVAQYINYGGISEYGAILQVLMGGLMVGSSVYLMKGRRMARQALEGALWLALLGSLGWVAAQDAGFQSTLAVTMLQLWIPLGLLIYGVRMNAVRAFVDGA